MDYNVLEGNGVFYIVKNSTVCLIIDTKKKVIIDLTGDKTIKAGYGKDR